MFLNFLVFWGLAISVLFANYLIIGFFKEKIAKLLRFLPLSAGFYYYLYNYQPWFQKYNFKHWSLVILNIFIYIIIAKSKNSAEYQDKLKKGLIEKQKLHQQKQKSKTKIKKKKKHQLDPKTEQRLKTIGIIGARILLNLLLKNKSSNFKDKNPFDHGGRSGGAGSSFNW